jgi:hypothetical protein
VVVAVEVLGVLYITELGVVAAGAVCGGATTESMVVSGSESTTTSSVVSVFLHETKNKEANTSKEKVFFIRYFISNIPFFELVLENGIILIRLNYRTRH